MKLKVLSFYWEVMRMNRVGVHSERDPISLWMHDDTDVSIFPISIFNIFWRPVYLADTNWNKTQTNNVWVMQ